MSLAEELRFLVYFPVFRSGRVRFSCPSDASYLLSHLPLTCKKLMQMHDYKEDKESRFIFFASVFSKMFSIDIHFSDIRSLSYLKKNPAEKIGLVECKYTITRKIRRVVLYFLHFVFFLKCYCN